MRVHVGEQRWEGQREREAVRQTRTEHRVQREARTQDSEIRSLALY